MRRIQQILGAAQGATAGAIDTTKKVANNVAVQDADDDESMSTVLSYRIAPSVAGAVVGMTLWPKHPWLGALSGDAVGGALYPMLRNQGDDRRKAICDLIVEGAAVYASLKFPKHPVWAYLGGALAGSVAVSPIRGSRVNTLLNKGDQ